MHLQSFNGTGDFTIRIHCPILKLCSLKSPVPFGREQLLLVTVICYLVWINEGFVWRSWNGKDQEDGGLLSWVEKKKDFRI